MAEYIEYHPLKFWLDPASIAEIVAHIQTYLVNNPINSTTEIETIIHDYLIAHPELIGGVDSVNGQTGEVVLTADNISGGENVTIKDVLDSLQDQIDDIVASIPSDYQQLIDDVSDLKSAISSVPITFTDGAYISAGNYVASNGSYSYSDYIPVFPGQEIHLRSYFHDAPRAVFVTYDKGTVKQAIENTTPNVILYDNVLTVPADAYFFRFSCRTENKSNSFVQLIVNPAFNELNEKTGNLWFDMDSVKAQISLPTKTITGWEQGTIADPTVTTRIHIDCGHLESGRISVSNAKSDGRVSVDVYSDAEHTNQISATGLKAGDFIAEISDGYVVIVGANSSYGNITPSYFSGYYDLVFSQYVNNAIEGIRKNNDYHIAKLTESFTDWKQGTATNGQIKTRVSVFLGDVGNGVLTATAKSGIQYVIEIYDSLYYDNRISTSGWKRVTTDTDIEKGEFAVVTYARTNYSDLDSSALDGVSVSFTKLLTDEIADNRNDNVYALITQNGIRQTQVVPYYYIAEDYLDGKIERINQLAMASEGIGGTFGFITDMHWKLNAKQSPALLNYIYHNTHVDRLFGGGDYSDTKNNDDTWFDVGSIIRDAWKGRAYYAMGNHEYLGAVAGAITKEENLAYFFGAYYGDEVVYGSLRRSYFYINDNGNKIRYIVLNRYAESTTSGQSANNGLEQEQLSWVQNVALNVESGWSIIIVVHSIFGFNVVDANTITPFVSDGSQGLVDIIEGYNGNGEIIGVISGHSHFDIVLRLSNDVPVIITTCDKNKTGGETPIYPEYWDDRADGTIKEQAFDIININKSTRKFTAVRIGCPATTWTKSGNNYVRGSDAEEREIAFPSIS